VGREPKVWAHELADRQFAGVIESPWSADYLDPNAFLENLQSAPRINISGWREPRFDSLLGAANRTTDTAERFRKLAECERLLLTGMPILPVYYPAWYYLEKPYVRGFAENPLGQQVFDYTRIDPNWR
jgi:ABC-type oligopeptide transport system substrate-binding subunit